MANLRLCWKKYVFFTRQWVVMIYIYIIFFLLSKKIRNSARKAVMQKTPRGRKLPSYFLIYASGSFKVNKQSQRLQFFAKVPCWFKGSIFACSAGWSIRGSGSVWLRFLSNGKPHFPDTKQKLPCSLQFWSSIFFTVYYFIFYSTAFFSSSVLS